MNGLEMYNEVGVYSEVLGASSQRQIQMLLERLLTQLSVAMSAIEREEINEKCKQISRANSIVMYLRDCLNPSDKSSIALRLDAIYGHLEAQLFLANARNDAAILQQCITIVSNIKSWWDNVAE